MPSHIERKQSPRTKSLGDMRAQVGSFMRNRGAMLRECYEAHAEMANVGTFVYFESWDYTLNGTPRNALVQYLTAIGEILVYVAPESKSDYDATIRNELSLLFTKGV